ncbi:chemotaxis protein CheW [Dyella sp. ASV21]|uniref:chemotaxis protein CheW n=1 Tax=Dyella sp. ASV21 TaxID=2795114 RepID=UPI0018EBB23C
MNPNPIQGADERWLSFRLGGQLYAAPLTQVSEVIRDGELTPVPGAASDLLGIRHLRGRIVPVLDGRHRLGMPVERGGDSSQVRLVMLSHGVHLVGLRVDAIGDLISVVTKDIAPPPPGGVVRMDEPVFGVYPWQGGFVALLDVRRLCRLPQEQDAA